MVALEACVGSLLPRVRARVVEHYPTQLSESSRYAARTSHLQMRTVVRSPAQAAARYLHPMASLLARRLRRGRQEIRLIE